MDVVQNVRRSFVTGSDGSVTPSFDGNLLAGAWETALEPTALAGSGRIQDTFTFFGAVQSQQIGVRTLVPGTGRPDGLALPDASLRAIEHDLDRGYVVVSAEAMPEGAEIAAWWRIDPRTGETLGRTAVAT